MLRWRVREIHSAIVDRYLFPFLSTNIGIMVDLISGVWRKYDTTMEQYAFLTHSANLPLKFFCDPSVTYHDSFSFIQSVPSPSPDHLCYGR